jgi:AcrR family transcriptional regulator
VSATRQTSPVRSYGGVSAQQRIAERRERLLEAALAEFGTRGFAATGVKDVCRRAGLTDRYFYESFKDGEELFLAVLDRATERLAIAVAKAVTAAPSSPEPQVRAAIEAFIRELADDERLARVVFREAGGAGPEADRRMRATLRRFADMVEATARPHLPERFPRKPLRLAAVSVVGAIERLVIEWQDDELEVSIEEVIDYVVGMFLGLGSLVGVTEPPSGASARRSTGSKRKGGEERA